MHFKPIRLSACPFRALMRRRKLMRSVYIYERIVVALWSDLSPLIIDGRLEIEKPSSKSRYSSNVG